MNYILEVHCERKNNVTLCVKQGVHFWGSEYSVSRRNTVQDKGCEQRTEQEVDYGEIYITVDFRNKMNDETLIFTTVLNWSLDHHFYLGALIIHWAYCSSKHENH